MSYLLDTCIISKLKRLNKYPDKKLEKWFSKHPEAAYLISVLTIGEIQAGISKLKATNSVQNHQKMLLEDWLYGELIPRFEGRILPVDQQVSLIWGKLIGESRIKGSPLPAVDTLIAATAIAHQLILVTENTRDFLDSGAILFNPWD